MAKKFKELRQKIPAERQCQNKTGANLERMFELLREIKKICPHCTVFETIDNAAFTHANKDFINDEELIDALQNYLDLTKAFTSGSGSFSNL